MSSNGSNVDEISEIIQKYNKEEALLEIKEREICEEIENNLIESTEPIELSEQMNDANVIYEKAIERNEDLLKEVELFKGNVRSKSIFSPAERDWEEIFRRYQEEPSLPPTSWRCIFPSLEPIEQ